MVPHRIPTCTPPATTPAVLTRSWATCALLAMAGASHAAQVTIPAPAGSGQFATGVTILPNGNIVVTDPAFDAPGPVADVGAVHLYRPDGTLVSTLRGSSANDRVGSGGVVVLANGNFVVRSPDWDNGAAADVGAVTFASGATGIAGVVAPANSLVGSTASDQVGSAGVIALTNGNYVVASPNWDNGAISNAGAATFGSGTNGVSGAVSQVNSLVGGRAGDAVGTGVVALTNGNYVVRSPSWDNGANANAGAATFGSGTSGVSGAVSQVNSLVGTTGGDQVSSSGVTPLSNGNYVVRSPNWRNVAVVGAGAATFGSGTTGIVGAVSAANSLVGSQTNDAVGQAVVALSNGNYVVRSPNWRNGAVSGAGAATFGSGTSGVSGAVSAANSLVGSTASDQVGSSVVALANGNYVVASPNWDNGGATNAGAATFGSGSSGISGAVSAANSLIGTTTGDQVGSSVTALTNGNYVVRSPNWDDGPVVNAGAATFGSGTVGIIDSVSRFNSLVGSAADNLVGSTGVFALSNGNYVVASALWDNGTNANVGAVTFASGTGSTFDFVSPANSLVGSTAGDQVGGSGVFPLANGNYVVASGGWDDGAAVDAGAATFGSGTVGIVGAVSSANSLVGRAAADQVGSAGVTALSGGDYVVNSPLWDDGAAVNAGAVTFGPGTGGITGVVSPANSVVGGSTGDNVGGSGAIALDNGNYVVPSPFWNDAAINDAGAITLGVFDGSVVGPITDTDSVLGTVTDQRLSQNFSYDPVRNQLAVGEPAANRLVLHRTGIATETSITGGTPDPSLTGQPVTFTAIVSASPGAPVDGQVTFAASSGESCVDTTPSATSATTATFSCTIVFTSQGASTVVAEYTGSIRHAYSGSAPEAHTTIAPLFANGFESP